MVQKGFKRPNIALKEGKLYKIPKLIKDEEGPKKVQNVLNNLKLL